jgi:eukaryotic-like serine/threonine-protein kinase
VTVLAAGNRIADRYQLDRRIAVGGMGEVWEAEDTRLGRSVAVKVLRPELSHDPEFLHRFRIEARTVASLDHSGIAAVHDYGEDDGPGGRRTAYLVMELVRGEPLSSMIARGPLPTDQTLRILEQAARALQAAHERGYVHRDVKPGNILIRTDGKVKLTDFGIAKAANAIPVTRSGMVMGTAHYIAPEQASGAEAGPAGDVYSLGIVGYECLAGHRPFRAESAVAVAMMQVREPPPPLPDTVPDHARELIDAVLVKDPTRRYGTGGELARAIAAVRRGEPLPAPGAPMAEASLPAVDETGETIYPLHPSFPSGGAVSGPIASVPVPSQSPISSPGLVPARPTGAHAAEPRAPRSGAFPASGTGSGASGSGTARSVAARAVVGPSTSGAVPVGPGSSPSLRPAAVPAPPTEPLRIPPARGAGRGVLLVLFVLLTLAALVLGVLLLRGELGDLAGAAAASAGFLLPGAGSVAGRDATAPDDRENRHR